MYKFVTSMDPPAEVVFEIPSDFMTFIEYNVIGYKCLTRGSYSQPWSS